MKAIPYEDREEIRELTHRAALYGDTKQIDKCLSLYASDGVLDESCVGMPIAHGTDQMRGFMTHPAADAVKYMTHFVTNHIISSYDGKIATGMAYVWFSSVNADGHRMEIRGYYDDVYAKINGRWRIKHRVLHNLVPPIGTPDAAPVEHNVHSLHFQDIP
ncbi:MAG: nuclear transport factor 2 family protein [Caulobacterales bacterium]